MKEKLIYAAIGVVIGIVFAQQIKSLPLVNKIPTV
jgi:large-conductance mechanosensitive channel